MADDNFSLNDTMTDEETAAEMNAPSAPAAMSDNPYDYMPAVEDTTMPEDAPGVSADAVGVPVVVPSNLSQAPVVPLTPQQQQQLVYSQTSTGGLTAQEQAELMRRFGKSKGPKESTLGGQRGPNAAIVNEAMKSVVQPPPAEPAMQSAQAPKQAPKQQEAPPSIEELMMQNALTPSVGEQQESLNLQMEAARKRIADESAAQMADQELSKYMANEQAKKDKMEAELTALDNSINNQVRAKSFAEIMSQGSFGQKFLAGLAVLAGGASMAYTGEKENPALAMIDKEVERQAQKDKLNFEQKSALKSQLLAAGQNIIKAAQQRFQNENTQQRLQLEYDKLADKLRIEGMKRQQALQNRYASDLLTQAQLQSAIEPKGSPEEIAAIKANNDAINLAFRIQMQTNPKEAGKLLEKRMVLPDGRIWISPAPIGQINKFSEARADIEGGMNIIDRIQDAAKKGNLLDPRDRAQIQSDITKLTGQLRLTYLGPGAMTQQEYDRLYAAIGDPSKIFTLTPIEMAKLNSVRDNLEADLAERAKSMTGARWPLTKRAQLVYQFRQRGYSPRESSEKADVVLQKLK